MKRFILTLTTAALLAPGLSFAQDATQPEPQKKTDKLRIFKAGGIGCLAGGGLALITGNKKQAAAACLAGGVVGGVASFRAQLNEAKEVADAAKAAGLDAQISTKEVQSADGQVEALDALTIRYNPRDMQPVSQKTAATLDKLAGLLKASKNQLTIRFEGGDLAVCPIPVEELYRRGALTAHRSVVACGEDNEPFLIRVTPIPDVR
ncbi:hypothetical protein [Xanthomonas perforans]|uniref:hypothetical protein n=1 Tax=Xanthomonas perforans TaxID=442694 RepID=UPI0011924C69|nr:hypothetical protein [Xanthomonas perforans]MDC9651041.1 hypothetical protein [Xanthomonas perforans]MDC9656461.1 hypothetical protein [Xanthomonas perforans]MDC9676627.1 hypothetical protein [Xanthomonas perforans]MDC9680458.1 hypothetical protein [Xanthomonas perforans]MDC9684674.1 hypothetical protein [Xanthomonas perforans]